MEAAGLSVQRQQEKNKELEQQEEMPSAIKKDGELLNCVSSDDADTEAVDSDDSPDFSEISQKNIQKSPLASGEPLSGDGHRYAGRLRTRKPTLTRDNWDFYTQEELAFFEYESEDGKSVIELLGNVEPLPNWGTKKLRTDRREERDVSPESNQATLKGNFRDYGRAKSSQDGLRTWSRCKPRNNPLPFDPNDRHRAFKGCQASAELKHENCSHKDHLGQSLHGGNAVAVRTTVSPGSPLRSLGRIGSSCKRNQPVGRFNMVTRIESFPTELGGHHEGPVAPMKPAIRKRKAEISANELPGYLEVNALSNRRARSNGTERSAQQQYYQLSSDGEEVTERSRFVMTALFEQNPPLPANLPYDTLQHTHFEDFLNGEFARGGTPYDNLDNLDAIGTGGIDRPSPLVNGSHSYPGRISSSTPPLDDLGAYIGPPLQSYSQGGADIFTVPDTDAFSIASEPSTNDSFGTGQSEARQNSDEDYHPPAGYSAFQSKTDNVGTGTQTSYPSRSRRSLSFRNNSVARRAGSVSSLQSDVDPASATPSKVTQPVSNTSSVVHVNPTPDNQHDPLSTTIASSMNDGNKVLSDVHEDVEPDDESVRDEEDEDDVEELFDLNEPPEQQPRKNSKVRKKHRPKVFREGRLYRRRKPKTAEEDISKTRASEGTKVVEKPKARKKRATADLKSTQGDLLEKQGSHATPVAANCGLAACGCAQCQENQQKESSQTPSPVLRRGPNNTLILGGAIGETGSLHAQDGSPFCTHVSGSSNWSRNRAGEDNDRLNGADNPVIRRVRRELFKKARGKRSIRIVKEKLGWGQICQELLNEATVHTSSVSAANTVEAVLRVRIDANHSRELGPLESHERSTEEALVDPCLIAAEDVAVTQRKWNPSSFEDVVSGDTRGVLAEVSLKEGSAITSKEIVLPKIGGRMRAAARAKSRHSSLSNRGKKPPSRRGKKPISIVGKSPPSMTTVDQVVNRMANLELNEDDSGLQLVPHLYQQTALVPYDGPFNPLRRKKLRAKVMLEDEDKRVWRLLMAKGTSFEDENSEKDTPRQWEQERVTMKTRAEKFINRMHLVQGDRRFSVWKGSVVDSVVGAFLTQNVSDHLSSSAFMCLAARFPVPRKKNVAADTSQGTTVTEVRVEEAFEISQKGLRLPVSGDDAEAVQEGSRTDFHVEEAFDNSEKSSLTGEGSSMCYNQQAYDTLSTKVTDRKFSGEKEPATESLERREGNTFQDYPGTDWDCYAEQRLTKVREQNSSCSSKHSLGHCCSRVHSSTSQAGESLEVRGSEQQQTCGVIQDFTFLRSGPEVESSGHSHMNSISPTAVVNVGDRAVTQMALPAASTWTGSQLLEGSLIVDLSPTADDLVSIRNGLLSHANVPRTQGFGGNSVLQEIIRCSDPRGLGVTRAAAAEEVAVSSGSVVSSSDSFDAQKLSQISVVPSSEVNFVVREELGANTGGMIFPSDSFDTNKSHDMQLVISSAAVLLEDTNKLEFTNLVALKSLMRRKIQVMKKALKKRDPNSRGVNNRKNNSEIVNSTTNDDQGKEPRDLKKRPVLGLTGIARARLEESNITSKVAFDWEAVRLKYTGTGPAMGENLEQESAHAGCKSFGSSNVENGVDWDAVRSAKLEDIAEVIKERGMNNVLAGRIKAFLERVQKEHGSVDLEWLRTVSVEEAKSFLLSVRGLGLKSVECIRLLTLHHLAFPVDTNVGRICVRLGWVPLEPLPEELQLHLLELYPVQETIQKYLWPRLCSLDQRTLYELHYQMITFGKVFCTKSRPNCNACPMRDDCQHFASALASARLALPAAAHEDAHSTNSEPLALPATTAAEFIQKAKLALPPSEQDDVAGEEGATLSKLNSFILSQKPCEPIVEEPRSPEPVVTEIEDIEDYETFAGVGSQPEGSDKGSSSEVEVILPPAEVSIHDTSSKALVLLPPGLASIPVPKLKNVGRLRTVHYVYELPDNHPLVQEMDPREADDPCVYLLAIWSPVLTRFIAGFGMSQRVQKEMATILYPSLGESPQAPPVLDDPQTNGACDGFSNSEEETVRGTVLVPCRTAMRGIFPLNGTYFQVNEVFADHASSIQPIEVPRTLLWNLRRRFVYFGTSVTTIFKGLSTEEIQACFWRGYVCVRGFDSVSRCPRPLAARLHFPASKMVRKQSKGEKNSDSNAGAEA